MDGGDLLPAPLDGIFKGELGYPAGSSPGNAPACYGPIGTDGKLSAPVEAFGVFPDDDQIDIFIPGLDAGQALDGPEIAVEVEFFPEGDIDTGKSSGNGGSQGPSGLLFLATESSTCWGGGAEFVNGGGTAASLPVDGYPGGRNNLTGRCRYWGRFRRRN